MPRQLHWSELRGGIISAAVIAVLIAATLLFARVGAIHGKKVTLYVVTHDATGVLAGTEVWLAGKKAGRVTDVSFRPPSSDTTERLLITTEFLADALPNVRRDSYAQIRPGGSLIGAPVLFIATGSAASPPAGDGDTIHTRTNTPIGDVVSKVGSIRPEVSALASGVKALNAQISRPTGTIGNFRTQGLPRLPDVRERMSRITGKATRGSGTIGLAMRRNLMARASRVMAAADSVRALLSSDKGSIGRFRRDTTLVTTAAGIMAQVDTLRALASDPLGSIGGAHSDSTLTRELDRTRSELDSLIRNIKAHPLRYINF
jgi:phospholipid/cholesterol/gamma-HCH transport system substrate-binding protein